MSKVASTVETTKTVALVVNNDDGNDAEEVSTTEGVSTI